jgi:hypothetical protein
MLKLILIAAVTVFVVVVARSRAVSGRGGERYDRELPPRDVAAEDVTGRGDRQRPGR